MNKLIKQYDWFYVYCIENVLNGKKYIGISATPHNRFKQHLNHAKNGYPNILYKAMRKYGISEDIWKLSIIDKVKSFNNVLKLENLWIAELKTNALRKNNFGYNMTDGGEGTLGRGHSEETKKKISNLMIKDGRSRGEKNPMYGRGNERVGNLNTFYGKSHSEESRQKISKNKKGISNPKVAVDPVLVKRMQVLSLSGISYPDIAKLLDKEGIKPLRNKNGNWNPATVHKLVTKLNKKEGIGLTYGSIPRVSENIKIEIFALHKKGLSPHGIAKEFNNKNIKSPKGSIWRDNTIRNILFRNKK